MCPPKEANDDEAGALLVSRQMAHGAYLLRGVLTDQI